MDPLVASFFLVAERKYKDRRLVRHVAVESHIAGLAKTYDQLTQLRQIFERPTHLRCTFQELELPLDRRSGTRRRAPVLRREEKATFLKPS